MELLLEDGNRFKGTVEDDLPSGGRKSGIYGYWDVVANALRMGTSAADAEEVAISFTGGELVVGEQFRSYYRRRTALV